jgi:hypothetical protein
MDFMLAKEMIERNNESILKTKSLLQSSLRKMTQTLEGNILHYKLSYMLVGILIILMVYLFLILLYQTRFRNNFTYI